ncbi:DUF6542 domain-containing protein [Streptomyces marispadix]|uniref:DUF6542 domain-containing protein n=1 Tax=Streptomyces marispadix TaxID=2922868 RepID=A0ABS9T1J7_9ACTN|nr:DUF6542 domain-containing protein [Streptomyces marispadix]MCH6162343.1 hypothetical protein [Streptomyces marispadix]
MEQQHSAHTGGKDPGQGQGPGQEQGRTRKRSQGPSQNPSQGPSQSRGQSQSQGPSGNEENRRRRPSRGARSRNGTASASSAGPADSSAGSASGSASGSPAGPSSGSPAAFSADEHTSVASVGGAVRESRRRGGGAVRQEAAALYQAQLRFPLIPAPLTEALSWLPRARLTALGSGLLGVLLMVLTGAADDWLLGGSSTVYGGAFVVVSVACASWVRPTDLVAAPVAVPLAFTAGLFLISGGAGHQSYMDRMTNLFPALAVNAFWLYAGTLVAVLIVTARKVALMVQQSRVRALMEAEDAEEEAAQAD